MTNDSNSVTAQPNSSSLASSLTWADLGIHTYVKIGIVSALIVWLFHVQIYQCVYLWADPSWSHGFLIPLFSLYFLNQRKKEILTLKPRPSYLGLALLIFCLVLFPLNLVQFKIGYFSQLLVLAVVGSVVLFLGGWQTVKYTWLPIGFLFFAIPLPDRLLKMITIPMRLAAAEMSTAVLNLYPRLEAIASGVVIDVVYKGVKIEPPMDVAEACSGMRLLMAFLALGVAMAYLHYRPFWQRIVLLLSTIPIAILCNIIRVTITGFIYVLISPKYAQGIYHDMLGMAMLPLAFGLYGLIAWFMSSLFVDETGQPQQDVVVRKRNNASVS
jgi:exosortase